MKVGLAKKAVRYGTLKGASIYLSYALKQTENMAKRNSKENGVHLPFNHDGFIQKWQEWLQYRKERRLATYVPTGLKKTFSKLITISNDNPETAMQIIDQSMENGWQGLFELKNAPNGANIKNTAGSNQAGSVSKARIQAAKDF